MKKPLRQIIESEVAVNSMGTSSSTAGTGPIDTVDPLLGKRKKMIRRKTMRTVND